MIITNSYNLPHALYDRIVDNIMNDPYVDKRDRLITSFRTTELIGAPLQRTLWLENLHNDNFVIDASEFLAVMFGTAFHKLCEGKNSKTRLYEFKVAHRFDLPGKLFDLFGSIDELELDKVITIIDNKTCVASNVPYEKPDYVMQLNIYKYLLQNYYPDNDIRLKLRYFIKDYSPKKKAQTLDRFSKYSYKYKNAESLPDSAVYYVDVPSYSNDEIEKFIFSRIEDHLSNPRRVCSDKERLTTYPEYAVMISGQKKSAKNCETHDQAQMFISNLDYSLASKAFIELRQPDKCDVDMKCQFYCKVRSVCPYAQSKGYKS